MKTIILFRHGKSDWNAHFEDDHSRPINKRGKNAAKKMGKHLSDTKEIPELLISSTALRARETIELAAQSGNWKSECIFEPKIYGGLPNALIEIIKNINEKFNSVCLIGHEPNFSSFISKSSSSQDITTSLIVPTLTSFISSSKCVGATSIFIFSTPAD